MVKTRSIALIAVFAALTAVLDALPGLPQLSQGVWYGWTFIATPLAGIVLGPGEAFLSVFIGVMISHTMVFFGPYEYFFTIGAPFGAMISSLVFRQRLRPVLLYYVVLLAAYFLTPAAWDLPLWALWDTYIAFTVLITIFFFRRRLYNMTKGRLIFAFSALIGNEADILFRIFLFVPLGTYNWLYGSPLDFVRSVWVVSAFITPIQVCIALFATSLAGAILLKAIRQ
jgi:divalent metal cation (Fe/Co/Zn/Cd) transporter